ncbi:MAG: hypothetical protein ABIQ53_10355, partial [Terracoccus sp.]
LPNGIRPEGITSGPSGTYYVGSLADGRIVTGNVRTGTQRTLLQGAVGRSLRGLFHDDRTGFVWAVGNVGDVAHVWAVNGHNGKVVSDTVIPGGVFLNDLVVTSNRVWVTDSSVDRLVAVPIGRRGYPTRGDLVVLPLRSSWPAGDGTSINANGIRELPDQSLVLNNSRVGGLWQVNRHTGAARSILVTGGPGIVSGDGLELAGSVLYNVRGTGASAVAVVRLRHSRGCWTAAWIGDLSDPGLDVPSTATVIGRSLYAVNARFGTPSPDTAEYWVSRLPRR